MKKRILLGLAAGILLAGCGQAGSGGSSDDNVDHTVVPELSDITTDISVSSAGFLTEISIGVPLASDSSYPISFSFSSGVGGALVKSDNENVLTVEGDASGSNWTVITHKIGSAHLIIEDGDTIIHFRKLVTVEKKLTQEETAANLVDVDHFATIPSFESFTGSMTIVFVEGGVGYISGYESGGVSLNNQSFSYASDDTYSSISENHEHWYIYKVSNWGISNFVFDYFAVWNTGDWIQAHTKNTLLGIFAPAAEE